MNPTLRSLVHHEKRAMLKTLALTSLERGGSDPWFGIGAGLSQGSFMLEKEEDKEVRAALSDER